MAGHTSDMRKLMRRAKKAGCTVTRTGGGHYKIITPNGTRIICSFSPRDNGAYRDTLRDLRRDGVQI